MGKPAANWNITTSSSIRRQIIISCSNFFFFHFWTFTLNEHFDPKYFLCEIDKLLYLRCTLIFFNIFGRTTKYFWYAQVIQKMRKRRIWGRGLWNTDIHILYTEKKNICQKYVNKQLTIECKQTKYLFRQGPLQGGSQSSQGQMESILSFKVTSKVAKTQ